MCVHVQTVLVEYLLLYDSVHSVNRVAKLVNKAMDVSDVATSRMAVSAGESGSSVRAVLTEPLNSFLHLCKIGRLLPQSL